VGSGCTVGEFHGETTLPATFTVLVTTPKAFESAQQRGEAKCSWATFTT
jgi:hypothetical protein